MKSINNNNRIEVLDYFRGLAIICVVLYHLISLYMKSLPGIIRFAANAGSSGVLVFFFCSGFSLWLSEYRRKRSYWEGVSNKVKKIYFPYIIVVVITACIPFLYTDINKFVGILSHILQFRCFSNTYFEAFGGHYWYLGTLFQFFLIFKLLLGLQRKLGYKIYAFLILVISVGYVMCLARAHQENNTILIRLFPKYLFEFGMGMVFAELYCTGKLTKWYKNYVYIIVGIIGIVLLGVSSKSALGRLLNDIPAFIGFLSFFFWMYMSNIQWMKYITIKISKCSFELYLLHMAILDVVFYYIHGSIISEMVAGLVSIVVAYVFAWGYSKLLLKCGLK